MKKLKGYFPQLKICLLLDALYTNKNEIDYEGHKLNVLECEETRNERTIKFVWLTNFGVDKTNFITLAKGAPLPGKIENEGFNMQKNGGYNLQHTYSQHPLALKNCYLLLQVAHIINQLMEKGSLIRSESAWPALNKKVKSSPL